jgi:hypothetical protein
MICCLLGAVNLNPSTLGSVRCRSSTMGSPTPVESMSAGVSPIIPSSRARVSPH